MKNLKFTFFAIILMAMALPQSVFAFDFSAVAPTGQTLYYNIVNGNAEVTYPQSYNNWGSYTKPTGVLTIPSTVSYNGTTYSVTSIGEYAFCNCSGLTSVTIPNSVTSIGNDAFSSCSGLTSVTIPNSVTSIDNRAFLNCSGLTSVTIPNSVTSIGYSAFNGCSSLTSVTIPNSVTSIEGNAFYNCSGLTSVTFNATNCTYMGSYSYPAYPVFYGCTNLSTLTIGDNVTNIPDYAFYGCSGLTSVTIPNSVDSIGNYAFYNCSNLTSVTIGSSVTSIGNYAFYNCSSLTSVTIGSSVTSIGQRAFNGCSSLISVTISSSVDTIGNSAFEGCTSLDTITMLSETPPVISSYTFEGVRTNVPIFVPCGSSDAYNEAAYWNVFTRIQEADSCNSVLTLAVNNSNLGCVRGAGMYRPGSQVEILAVPAAGKQFIRWNDANTNNPRTITINSDTAFTAIFDTVAAATVFHNITVTSSNMAMGSGMGSGSYAHGTVATIVAVPAEGFAFSTWHDGNTSNPRSVTVTENNFYVASFVVSETFVQHDTTYVDNYIHDTTYVDNYIHDTTYVDNYIHDTTYVDNWIYDTTYVSDTLWLTQYDTIWMHDTIIIHDTIYISQEGVDGVAGSIVKVYSNRGQIVVEGSDGNEVTLYDAVGRQLAVRRDEYGEMRFDVQASGVYFIRVGSQPAKRIVAIR